MPVLESLFNKVTGLKACNFTKKRLQHRSFHVKFEKYLRTSANDFFWHQNREKTYSEMI